MDDRIEQVLEECQNDIEDAIKRLTELSLQSSEVNSVSTQIQDQDSTISNQKNLPVNTEQWADMFVMEMMNSTTIDDAKTRAVKILEVLQSNITERIRKEESESSQRKELMLKDVMETISQENGILKRAFLVLHKRRQREIEDRNREVQSLKALVSRYQKKHRASSIKSYVLSMQLNQAMRKSSNPGNFQPDVA